LLAPLNLNVAEYIECDNNSTFPKRNKRTGELGNIFKAHNKSLAIEKSLNLYPIYLFFLSHEKQAPTP
jgi:hypothetical protein